MFKTTLLTIIYQDTETVKCLLISDWINKRWRIYRMEYYSAEKKNEILPFIAAYMGLESIMLSETNHRERQYYLYVGSKK